MKYSFIKKLKLFINIKSGATLIEFSIITPVFILMLLMILEFSLILYLRSAIEEVVRNTSRMAATGSLYNDIGETREEAISRILRDDLLAVALSPEELTFRSEIYDRFSDLQNPNNATVMQSTITNKNAPIIALGNSGQVVKFRVNYNHNYITPLAALIDINNFDTSINLTSTVYIQNEEF